MFSSGGNHPVGQIVESRLNAEIGAMKKASIELSSIEVREGSELPSKPSKIYFNEENGSKRKSMGLSSGYHKGESASSDHELTNVISRDEERSVSTDSEVTNEEDDTMYPDGGWKAWSVVLGSFLGSIIVFGIMNTIGVMETELETNIIPDASVSSVSWIFSVYMFVSLFMGIVVGACFDTIGGKPLLISGTLIQFAGMFACGNCTEVWHFIVSFGIVVGLGTALSLTPVVACVSHYFKRKRGFAIGVAQSGGNVGGIIFPIMLRSTFPQIGFVWSMRIMSFIVLALNGAAVLLCTDRLEIVTKDADGSDPKSKLNTFWIKLKSTFDIEALKDRSFLLLLGGLFLNEFSLLLVLTYLSSYAVVQGWSISTSYIMITVLNACGTVGKWIPPRFADLIGPFNIMTLMSATMSIMVFCIWRPLGGTNALWFFNCVFGFCCAATYSLSGACVGYISKTSDFGRRYGTAYSFVSFGNLISLPLGGALIKTGTIADYNNMVVFAGATCLLGTIFFILARISVGGPKFMQYV